MISKISLSNFKAFGEQLQEIPIRPITLIFGPNSSGKSSLLHSLLLARHALDNDDLNARKLSVGGDSVNLGGFSGYVYRHQIDNQVTFVLDLDYSEIIKQAKSGESKTSSSTNDKDDLERKLSVGIVIGRLEVKDENETHNIGGYSKEIVVKSYWLEIGGQEILRLSYRDDGLLHMDMFDYDHPFNWKLLVNAIQSFTTSSEISEEDEKIIKDVIDDIVPRLKAKARGFALGELFLDEDKVSETESQSFFAISKSNREQDIKETIGLFFPKIANNTLKSFSTIIERRLKQLHYLGPLRTYPPRHMAFSTNDESLNEANGGAAWRLIMDNEDIRNKVNIWLRNEKNSTAYEIVVTNYVVADIVEQILENNLGDIDIDILQRDDVWWKLADILRSVISSYSYDNYLDDTPEEIKTFLKREYNKRNDFLLQQLLTLETTKNYININTSLFDAGLFKKKTPQNELKVLIDDSRAELEKFKASLDKDGTVIFTYEESGELKFTTNLGQDGIADVLQRFNNTFVKGVGLKAEVDYLSYLLEVFDNYPDDDNMGIFTHEVERLAKELDSLMPMEEIQEGFANLTEPPSQWLGLKYKYETSIPDASKSAQEIIKKILDAPFSREPDIYLADLRNKTAVTLRDVGIGISQVIPVITYAHHFKDSILAIEQPELHLHPALQAELGDLFIETALGDNKNTYIIETHSEHLILRLLRRIRETADGELTEGLIPIKPNDVAVVYAEPTDEGTILHHIEITKDGDFRKKWPEGFFTERADELF